MTYQRVAIGLVLVFLCGLVPGFALAGDKEDTQDKVVEELTFRGEVTKVSTENKFGKVYFKVNKYPLLIFVDEATQFVNQASSKLAITMTTAALLKGKPVEVKVKHIPEKGVIAETITVLTLDQQYQVREEAVRANKPKLHRK